MASLTGRKAQAYDESNIKVFRGVAGVAKRPTMYLGERGDQMVWRALKELVDNCVDEAFAGRNDTVELYLDTKNDTYIVADHAHGIPVGFNSTEGKSTLDIVFTELHGGGKFDDSAYKTSAGVHGLGAACTNAISDSLRVWTKRDDVWYYREYDRGIPTVEKVARVRQPDPDVLRKLSSKATAYGTIIEFIPNQEIVSKDATNARVKEKEPAKLPVKQVLHWCKMIALMNPGLRIIVSNSSGKRLTFFNGDDISAIVKQIVEDNELTVVAKPFVLQTEKADLTFQWTSHDDINLFHSYVNCSPTRDHGKHYQGFTSALGRVLQSLKKDVAVRGKNNTFKTSDALYGLVGSLNFKMSEPEFSSQTKDRLTSNIDKDMEELLLEPLYVYFDKHKALAATVIKRAMSISKGRDELKKVMQSVGEVRKNQRGMLLPNVLITAESAKPHERELMVCEGDSAGGTAADARDPKFQEVFKLRGKITNASRTDMTKLIKSQVVQDFLVALGVDLKSIDLDADSIANMRFSSQNLRVGYVMIMCDADSDGGHIAVLLMSVIQRLIPSLYEEDRVFIVRSPLFLATHKNKRYFGDTLDECRANLPTDGKNAHITRAKGLGELDAGDLYEVAFNPEKRKLFHVKPPSTGDGLEYFDAITGTNSAVRKELLGL
jgi:DNA gyrase/topoisomerase IV subunit B